ncbi:MAG: PilW family protein [Gammaproteobacteria bacterium]|nr:PilW family protein [Gammaproteobacteria bacterium]
MTLVELTVAMAIGVFLTWGAFQVYVQSKSNFRAAEVNTRLNENARFALETIEPDLRLAGFWGRHREAALVAPAGGIAVSCDGDDVTAWALDLAAPVEASDDVYDLGCAPFSAARAGSDVLVVRHASDLLRAPQAGQVQVQSSLAMAQLFADGGVPAGFGADSETRDLVVHAYYVDDTSSFTADLPSLRRQTLVAGALVEDQEIVSGVENLQVQFGLDANGDGTVERYVDPDDAAAVPGAIVAVRLWLLLRSEESPGAGYTDPREYQPLDADAPVIVPGDAPYPAGFQRLEVTKTIGLRNQVTG